MRLRYPAIVVGIGDRVNHGPWLSHRRGARRAIELLAGGCEQDDDDTDPNRALNAQMLGA